MKNKIILSLALAATALTVSAQDTPNRMIVHSQSGTSAFSVDRVEEISFDKISGPVAANVKVLNYTESSVSVSVNRTADCQAFMINVFPYVIAKQLEANPAGAGSYMRSFNSPTYYEDFESGNLTGIDFDPGTEYAVVTLGIDKYGVECDVCAARFETPSADLMGDPQVDVSFVSATKTSVTVNFQANDDVSVYYAVIGEKGTLEQQYETFAPMFGFSNMAQMVKSWGLQGFGSSEEDHSFTGLDPNTDYEIYYVAYDYNDTAAPVCIFDCSTEKQGGEGASVVSISLGQYKLEDWDGEMLPSQFINFTPNDQTWCYRIGVYLESSYDENCEAILDELCSDPEMPMAYWFQYEPLTTDFQINPSTKAVAVAAGKNAKGEWGEVTEFRFTTPAAVGQSKAKLPASKSIMSRGRRAAAKGMIPAAPAVRLTR
ncbi:MAG: hypothetical protein NC336_07010 [Clostridium sp.]|nr:hypothetical protein [Clostridium sp.]